MTSPQVPENIRFLIQTYPKFSAILTGSRRLKRLREEYWSALYGLGPSIPVTALDTERARKVVTEPVRDQLVFSQEAIERVIEVTARHPRRGQTGIRLGYVSLMTFAMLDSGPAAKQEVHIIGGLRSTENRGNIS